MPRRRRPIIVLYAFVLLSSSCRVERTPEDYIDHGTSVEEVRLSAQNEVRDRLLAFVAAVSRGDGLQAGLALSPSQGVRLITPLGAELEGDGAVRTALAQLVTTPVSLTARELDVHTAGAGGTAWFRMVVEAPGATPDPALYHTTGTFVNDAGLWTLVQAHVSGPVTTDSGPPPSNQADSAATPAEGE